MINHGKLVLKFNIGYLYKIAYKLDESENVHAYTNIFIHNTMFLKYCCNIIKIILHIYILTIFLKHYIAICNIAMLLQGPVHGKSA